MYRYPAPIHHFFHVDGTLKRNASLAPAGAHIGICDDLST